MTAAAEALAEVGRAIRAAAIETAAPDWWTAWRRERAQADEALYLAAQGVLAGDDGARQRLRAAVEARRAVQARLAERVR